MKEVMGICSLKRENMLRGIWTSWQSLSLKDGTGKADGHIRFCGVE